MILLLLCSIFGMFSTNPMFLVMIILTSSVMICTLSSFFTVWLSYLIFLIFIGGMMVMYMYIVSIHSNKSFLGSMLSPILILILLSSENFNHIYTKQIPNLELLFLEFNIYLTLIAMVYLLVTLMIVIKMIYFNKGPMRNSN